jgi:hypothetical protein
MLKLSLRFSGCEHQVSGGQVGEGQVRHDEEVDGAAARGRSRSSKLFSTYLLQS